MKRRDFLAASSSMMLPVMLGGFNIKALGRESSLVKSVAESAAAYDGRVLVIIYLNGGNDGLNTVIPLDQYDAYSGLRSNIAIPQNQVLPLNGNPATGFHPSMTGLQQLYDEGKLAIINSVSYPDPNLSHHRSTEILMTGVESNQYETTGWAGRYLGGRFPHYQDTGYTENNGHPLALQIGYLSTQTLLGQGKTMSVSIEDTSRFYALIGTDQSAFVNNLPCNDQCDASTLIKFVRKQQVNSVGFAAKIRDRGTAGRNIAIYPDNNELAAQLKIVARLIDGGLESKIYFVEMNGFDTHSAQTTTNPTEGSHALLLRKLSDGISAFQNDLKQLSVNRQAGNLEDQVIGMTFSDFGRRATSNTSLGTDHGVAAPMFVFGTGIKRQNVGMNPDLTSSTNDLIDGGYGTKNIKMQIDFRRVYSDILNGWFGTSEATTAGLLYSNASASPPKVFPTISLFSDYVETIKPGAWNDKTTWSVGRIPYPSEIVKINNGHTVTLNDHVTIKYLRLEGVLDNSTGKNVTITG